MRIAEFVEAIAEELKLTKKERRAAVSALRFIKDTETVSPDEQPVLKKAVAGYIKEFRKNREPVAATLKKRLTTAAPQNLTQEPPANVILNRCPICHQPYSIVLLPGDVEAKYCPTHRIVVPFPGENNIKYIPPHRRDGSPIIPSF